MPRAAWKQWEADAKKYQKELDAALAFEDQFFGLSTNAYARCYEALRPGVQRYVKASKIKSLDGFVEAMSDPTGYLLASSFGACMSATEGYSIGYLLLDMIKRSRVWRGPRTAVGFAMLDELSRILQDRTRCPMNPRAVSTDLRNLLVVEATDAPRTKIPASGGAFREETRGVVKAPKKTKEKTYLIVDFKTETCMEPTSTPIPRVHRRRKTPLIRDFRVSRHFQILSGRRASLEGEEIQHDGKAHQRFGQALSVLAALFLGLVRARIVGLW